MAQAIHIGRLVTGLVVLAGRHAVHQVIQRTLWPGLRDRRFGQVRGNRLNARRQLPDSAAQAAYLPAFAQHLQGQTPTYITTTHHHHGKV
ncbi:hypothetical protein D3C80_1834440 [compost metagenome]